MENVEEDSLVKDRVQVYNGPVPQLQVVVDRSINNKKATSISNFELFKIQPAELSAYLANKCAASATIITEVGSAKWGAKET